MVQSDALSRRPDLCPDEDTDNEDKTLLPDSLFVNAIDTDLHDLISSIRKQDRVVLEALDALKTGGLPPMRSVLSDWRIEDQMVFFKNRCYVPDDMELRRSITQ